MNVCLVTAHTLPQRLTWKKRLYLNDWFQVFSKEVKGQLRDLCMPNGDGMGVQLTDGSNNCL